MFFLLYLAYMNKVLHTRRIQANLFVKVTLCPIVSGLPSKNVFTICLLSSSTSKFSTFPLKSLILASLFSPQWHISLNCPMHPWVSYCYEIPICTYTIHLIIFSCYFVSYYFIFLPPQVANINLITSSSWNC